MKKRTLGKFLATALCLALTLGMWAGVMPIGGVLAEVTILEVGQGKPFADIPSAIAAAQGGETILLAAGEYYITSSIVINKTVILTSEPGATIYTSGANTLFRITASGTQVQGLIIIKTDKTSQLILELAANNLTINNNLIAGQYIIGDPEVTRAMVPNAGIQNLLVTNNTIFNLRQPGYLNGGSALIANNYVAGTKGWVVAGGGFVFSDNYWGTGVDKNVLDIAIITDTPAGEYPDILALSQANNGAEVEDQRVITSRLTSCYLDANVAVTGNGNYGSPVKTLPEAIAKVVPGGTIYAAAGKFSANQFVISKPGVTVEGAGVGQTIFELTANYDGFNVGNLVDNVTLRNFTITSVTGPTQAKYGLRAQGVDNLTVENVRIANMAKTAFDLNGVTDSTFTGIVAENNGGYGVSINQSSGITVSGNTANNAWGAVLVANKPQPVFRNQLTDNIDVSGVFSAEALKMNIEDYIPGTSVLSGVTYKSAMMIQQPARTYPEGAYTVVQTPFITKWVVDRTAPKFFDMIGSYEGQTDVYKETVAPPNTNNSFYDYQGMKRVLLRKEANWSVASKIYISQDMISGNVQAQTGIWLSVVDSNDIISGYPLVDYKHYDISNRQNTNAADFETGWYNFDDETGAWSAISGVPVTAGWHDICFEVDNGVVDFYIDGVLVKTKDYGMDLFLNDVIVNTYNFNYEYSVYFTEPVYTYSDTLTVGPGRNFADIADALAQAENGDVIKVYPGTYVGDLAIDKAVTIMGVDANGVAIGSVSAAAGNVIDGNVSINVEGVTLQGMTVNGDVTIGEAVGNGEAYLKFVAITDGHELIVSGGGANSIYLEGVDIPGVVVDKEINEAGEEVVSVNIDAGSAVDSIEFRTTASLETEIVINGVVVATTTAGEAVNITGTVNNMQINAPATVNLTNGSTVGSLNVADTAAGTTVDVPQGASVTSAIIEGDNTSLTGTGSVGTAAINADGVIVERQPENITSLSGTIEIDGTVYTTLASLPTPTETAKFAIGTVNGTLGDTVSVFLNVTENTTNGIGGMSFKLNYDSTWLTLVQVKPVAGGPDLVVNGNRVAFASGSAYVGTGAIAEFVFEITDERYNVSDVALAVTADVYRLDINNQEVLSNIISDGIGAPIYADIAAGAVTVNPKLIHLGDVNDDGFIDASDAVLILRYTVGNDLKPWQLAAADVSGGYNGVDASDASSILQLIVRNIVAFNPAG